jgi:hypothetical protein
MVASMVDYPQLFGLTFVVISMAYAPLSVANAVVSITVLCVAVQAWLGRSETRLDLLGWVVVFAVGVPALSLFVHAAALIGGLVAFDEKSMPGIGAVLWLSVSQIPWQMIGGATMGFAYGRVLGMRNWLLLARSPRTGRRF